MSRRFIITLGVALSASLLWAQDKKPNKDEPAWAAEWRVTGIIRQGQRVEVNMERSGLRPRFVREGDRLPGDVYVLWVNYTERSVTITNGKELVVRYAANGMVSPPEAISPLQRALSMEDLQSRPTAEASPAISPLQRALSMEDPGARGAALSEAFGKGTADVGGGNPAATMEKINNLESQRDRDFAINGYASALVHSDPDRAIALAQTISMSGLREAAVERLTSQTSRIGK